MHRQPSQLTPNLEASLDERYDLLVQLSLAEDAPDASPHKIVELRQQLAALEREIKLRWKNPYV